jgi:hypothetical protein
MLSTAIAAYASNSADVAMTDAGIRARMVDVLVQEHDTVFATVQAVRCKHKGWHNEEHVPHLPSLLPGFSTQSQLQVPPDPIIASASQIASQTRFKFRV